MLPEWVYSLIIIAFLGGILLLAMRIGKYRAEHPPERTWETIRYYQLDANNKVTNNPDYRIPQWIRNKIKHADLHASAHKLHEEGMVWYLRGKYYEYKIYTAGQSGTDITIQRRKIG